MKKHRNVEDYRGASRATWFNHVKPSSSSQKDLIKSATEADFQKSPRSSQKMLKNKHQKNRLFLRKMGLMETKIKDVGHVSKRRFEQNKGQIWAPRVVMHTPGWFRGWNKGIDFWWLFYEKWTFFLLRDFLIN